MRFVEQIASPAIAPPMHAVLDGQRAALERRLDAEAEERLAALRHADKCRESEEAQRSFADHVRRAALPPPQLSGLSD